MTTEASHHDDWAQAFKTYVYLNLWSKGDPTAAARAIRSAMYAAGFSMVEESNSGPGTETAYDEAARRYGTHWTWVIEEAASAWV
jgi:hypothetical protein